MIANRIVKAWRDPAFRSALTEEERNQLPGNPAGMIELHGTALDMVAGASGAEGSGSSKSGSSKSSKSGSSGSSKSGSHKSGKSH